MTDEELKAIEEKANTEPGDTPFAMIEGLLTGVLSDRPTVLDHCRSTIEYAREKADEERASTKALVAEVRRLRAAALEVAVVYEHHADGLPCWCPSGAPDGSHCGGCLGMRAQIAATAPS